MGCCPQALGQPFILKASCRIVSGSSMMFPRLSEISDANPTLLHMPRLQVVAPLQQMLSMNAVGAGASVNKVDTFAYTCGRPGAGTLAMARSCRWVVRKEIVGIAALSAAREMQVSPLISPRGILRCTA